MCIRDSLIGHESGKLGESLATSEALNPTDGVCQDWMAHKEKRITAGVWEVCPERIRCPRERPRSRWLAASACACRPSEDLIEPIAADRLAHVLAVVAQAGQPHRLERL